MVKAANLIMVSNDFISVLFAVHFLSTHISTHFMHTGKALKPSHNGPFLIHATIQHAFSSDFKVFKVYPLWSFLLFLLCVTVQFKAACSPMSPLYRISFDCRQTCCFRPESNPFHPFNDVFSSYSLSPTGLSFTLLCTGIYM